MGIKVTSEKERRIAITIAIMGVCLGIILFGVIFTNFIGNNKTYDLQGVEVSGKDYHAINNLIEDKDYSHVRICNFESGKCSILIHLS